MKEIAYNGVCASQSFKILKFEIKELHLPCLKGVP